MFLPLSHARIQYSSICMGGTPQSWLRLREFPHSFSPHIKEFTTYKETARQVGEKNIAYKQNDKSDGYRLVLCGREEILFPWLLPVIFQAVCYRWNERSDFGDNRRDNVTLHKGSNRCLQLYLFYIILSRLNSYVKTEEKQEGMQFCNSIFV